MLCWTAIHKHWQKENTLQKNGYWSVFYYTVIFNTGKVSVLNIQTYSKWTISCFKEEQAALNPVLLVNSIKFYNVSEFRTLLTEYADFYWKMNTQWIQFIPHISMKIYLHFAHFLLYSVGNLHSLVLFVT